MDTLNKYNSEDPQLCTYTYELPIRGITIDGIACGPLRDFYIDTRNSIIFSMDSDLDVNNHLSNLRCGYQRGEAPVKVLIHLEGEIVFSAKCQVVEKKVYYIVTSYGMSAALEWVLECTNCECNLLLTTKRRY